MSKILIPDEISGKELFKFLIENKAQLVAQKKAMMKYTEPVMFSPEMFNVKGATAEKTEIDNIAPDATSVRVKVVANAAWYCDSAWDVLLPDCWKKSIKERKGMIPHIHDHKWEIGAEVGDVADVYSQDISLTQLGLNRPGYTQCLIFETDVKKEYNSTVFNKYKAGKVKQHSIGLRYVKISLAINDEENEKEYDFWKKNIQYVINKEEVEERGFFWVVSEIQVLENSAVLLGANQLTPTLEVKADTLDEPVKTTHEEPPHAEAEAVSKAIRETKFFN